LRKDFISCDAPLLKVPPADIALKYTEAIYPGGRVHEWSNQKQIKGNAFMICTMINALNEAAVYYKNHHCDMATANYEYSYVFHKNMTM
jgi:hypothetical protein